MRRTEPSRRHSTSTTMSMVTTFIKILTEGRIFIRFIKQVTESEWIQRSKVEIKGKLFLIKKAVRLRHMNYFLSTGSLPVSAHRRSWDGLRTPGLLCGKQELARLGHHLLSPRSASAGSWRERATARTEPGLSAP